MAKIKTFPELWASLDAEARGNLRARIIADTHVSDVAFWRWCTGQSRPGTFPIQQTVIAAVNAVLNTDYNNINQLFM